MLLFFYGQECSHCHVMMPLVEKLEKEANVKFEKNEIWHNENNESIFNGYAKNLCPGVPFFFNTENGKFICGESSYEELKAII